MHAEPFQEICSRWLEGRGERGEGEGRGRGERGEGRGERGEGRGERGEGRGERGEEEGEGGERVGEERGQHMSKMVAYVLHDRRVYTFGTTKTTRQTHSIR